MKKDKVDLKENTFKNGFKKKKKYKVDLKGKVLNYTSSIKRILYKQRTLVRNISFGGLRQFGTSIRSLVNFLNLVT